MGFFFLNLTIVCMLITFIDCLLKEVTVLKEEITALQHTVSELNQHRDTLQERLERKNDLLCSSNRELDDKVSVHRYK